MTTRKEKQIKRFLLISLSALGLVSPATMAQMPSPLLLGVEPSVPVEIWNPYEAQMQDVIFCERPLSLTTSQIREFAIAWDQAGNASIVPPRSFRIMGFQVQSIQAQQTSLNSYRYHSTNIVSTIPAWTTVTDRLMPTSIIAAQSDAAAILKLTCPPS